MTNIEKLARWMDNLSHPDKVLEALKMLAETAQTNEITEPIEATITDTIKNAAPRT